MYSGTVSYWDDRYRKGGNSGSGSQGEARIWKAHRVNIWAGKEVLDIGCGDGEQAELYTIPLYTGIDPSPAAIMAAADRISKEPDWQWFVMRDTSNWFPRHTHMSIDVIYHLVDDHDYYEHLRLLFSAQQRVIIYSSNEDPDPDDAPHVRHRKFLGDVPKGWQFTYFEIGPHSPSNFYVYDRA